MKSILTINPAITENTERSIIKAHASFIDLKVGVSLDHIPYKQKFWRDEYLAF